MGARKEQPRLFHSCRYVDFSMLACPLTKNECAENLSINTEIEVVQIIGKTLLLFCQNPDDPKIKLTNS